MHLAVLATRYMIWLHVAGALFIAAVGIWQGDPRFLSSALFLLGTAFLLWWVLQGLRKEILWVAILFLVICVLDLVSAIRGGTGVENTLNMLDAVLSFVAIYGISSWLAARKRTPSEEEITGP